MSSTFLSRVTDKCFKLPIVAVPYYLGACLGLLPGNPSPVVIVPGVPAPIVVPTAAPTAAPTPAPTTVTTTTARPPTPGNMTAAPTLPPLTVVPTAATTPPPVTTVPTAATTIPTFPPFTMVPPTVTFPPLTTAPTTLPPVTTVTMAPPTLPPVTTVTMPPMTLPPVTTVTMAPTTLPPLTTVTPVPTVTTAAPTQPPPVTTPQPTLGPLPIDPRLGTTPAPSAALNMPPITGYSAQVPSYDTAVKFPRSRRSVARKYDLQKDLLDNFQETNDKHHIVKRQSCACVPIGTCVRTSGAGMIDVRIVTPVQCPAGQEYCCGPTTPVVTPITCGRTQTVPPTAIAPAAGQASFGEFPWQALILTRQNDYIAGGVLIDALNVITVTHRMLPYAVSGTAPNVKVRLGDWDAAGTYEPVPFQEYTVAKVFGHPMYNANTLQYDIMVLRLSSAVPFTPAVGAAVTINRACLPPTATTVYTGQRCMVSGWGKNMFGQAGQFQQILKKVDVPIVAPATCQTQLQAARLGASYTLDTSSFICAGGEANKDSCTGDGGSGLVCQVNGQWVVVGLVSWGLGCANANVPGVYVNVAAFLPWIQQQVATP